MGEPSWNHLGTILGALTGGSGTSWDIRGSQEPVNLFYKGKCKVLGGPGSATDSVKVRVLARMKKWVSLVRAVVAAEFPDYNITSALKVFSLQRRGENAGTGADNADLRRLAQFFDVSCSSLTAEFTDHLPIAKCAFKRDGKSAEEAWAHAISSTQLNSRSLGGTLCLPRLSFARECTLGPRGRSPNPQTINSRRFAYPCQPMQKRRCPCRLPLIGEAWGPHRGSEKSRLLRLKRGMHNCDPPFCDRCPAQRQPQRPPRGSRKYPTKASKAPKTAQENPSVAPRCLQDGPSRYPLLPLKHPCVFFST
eukprot:556199-Pyramimonas_sp.AAC.1